MSQKRHLRPRSITVSVVAAFLVIGGSLALLGGAGHLAMSDLSDRMSQSARSTEALEQLRRLSTRTEAFLAAPSQDDLAPLLTSVDALAESIDAFSGQTVASAGDDALSVARASLVELSAHYKDAIETTTQRAALTDQLYEAVKRGDAAVSDAIAESIDAALTLVDEMRVGVGPLVQAAKLSDGAGAVEARIDAVIAAARNAETLRALAEENADVGMRAAKRLRFALPAESRDALTPLTDALTRLQASLTALRDGAAPAPAETAAQAEEARAAISALRRIDRSGAGDALNQQAKLLGAIESLNIAVRELNRTTLLLGDLKLSIAGFLAAPAAEGVDNLVEKLNFAAKRTRTAAAEASAIAPSLATIEQRLHGLEAAMAAPALELAALRASERDLRAALDANSARLASAVAEHAAKLAANGVEAAQTAQLIIMGALVTGFLACFGAYRLISYRVVRPIRRLTGVMKRLSAGDVDVEVPETRRRDEVAAMTEALHVFQQNAVTMRRLGEEKEASDRRAAAERAEMMERMRGEFVAVVDAAIAGDFSKRVAAEFEDEALTALANGVNKLVETVDRGVSETIRVASSLAEGDLTSAMHGQFAGAFAELKRSLNASIARLNGLIGEVSSEAEEMRRASGGIQDDAAALAERAERQASSLSETAATMEQMTTSIRNNARNAERAQNLSTEAADSAQRGGEVLTQTVGAMTRIEESSTKISDIVGVIDSIAFQTNLLALNAAVEAARAGEAGKGFSVVAAEVRSLAQRSAEAARDIGELIAESSGHVSSGVDLVKRTEGALGEIASVVAQVAETVADITTTNNEQATGADEIADAVAHMDEMTHQNATMADQSAAAARGLAAQSTHLAEQMRRFTTSEEQAPDEEAAAA